MAKVKDRENLQSSKESQSADFSTETFQARRDWYEIFKVRKSMNLQLRLVLQARLPFKSEGEIKSLPDKKKLKESITTKPVLQELLKGLLLR